jgi:hypothetical protein
MVLLRVTLLDLNPVIPGYKALAQFNAPFPSSAFAVYAAFRICKYPGKIVNF